MKKNILITRHDKIGDFVVSLPMFKALKTQRPELVIHALVAKVNFEFAQQISYIDHVILYDADHLDETLAAIKAANIDTSISAFINSTLGWLLLRAKVKTRIAPATKIAQIFFNKTVKQRRSRVEKREFEYNLDLLLAFDPTLNLAYTQPLIDFPASQSAAVIADFRSEYKIPLNHKIIAFHPGSGGSAEGNLKVEDYIELARSLTVKANITLVFTFGPDDQTLREHFSQEIDFDVVMYNSTGSLSRFCMLLSHFSLFVSTSTGTMHLSAASNINTLSFFGEALVSSPQRWASVSQAQKQHNIVLPSDYSDSEFHTIKQQLLDIIDQEIG
ncbi:MAG: glycosyltransferase family 9 protein [Oceanospirillaceae bacterium]